MGRYFDELCTLQDLHDHKTNIKIRTGDYSVDGSNLYYQLHEQLEDSSYRLNMRRLIPLVKKEMVEEITEEVMKRIDVKFVDEATPALKSLNKELDKLFGKR